MKDWADAQVHKKSAGILLGILAFTESSFFPIPPDFLLTPMVLLRREKWFTYATIATIASTLGGLLGYAIGALLYDTVGLWLINTYSLQGAVHSVQIYYDNSAFLATFISAFTFIPYKVFTIAGGIFNVKIVPFVIASFLGRGIRFYLEAFLMYRFGEKIGKVIYRYFAFAFLFAIILILIFVFVV